METGAQAGAQAARWFRRRPPTGLAGAVFWLAVLFVLLWMLQILPGTGGASIGILQVIVGLALLGAGAPLLWRFTRQRLLWSLRNKLVLTYLLIGLAPVVLFVTLVLISAYVAAGQFSIHLAGSRLQTEMDRLGGENFSWTTRLISTLPRSGGLTQEFASNLTAQEPGVGREMRRSNVHAERTAFLDGREFRIGHESTVAKTPLGLPPWALKLPSGSFQGMVLDGDDLYLVAIQQQKTPDGHDLSIVSSLAVGERLMQVIAEGLGRAGLVPLLTGGQAAQASSQNASPNAGGPVNTKTPRRVGREEVQRALGIFGGDLPAPVNVLDLTVRFPSTLPVTNWDTGELDNVPVEVYSRPSLLYRQLFGASLSGIVANVIRIGLVVLCVVFGLIELLALIMALRLSRTVTASVTDLYQATLHVDQGDFNYRIGVERNDQLADLGRSFNRMMGSLQRLLKEQKEKERLQNEISIAQEVQANLFPQKACGLQNLDLYGVCRPARSVSGDYYDFLTFHEKAHDGRPDRRETGVGIAIGDISGKGISAALLMATLHSAVRAYRFASEELVFNEETLAALNASRDGDGGCDELFESPGRILSLLNRHLYRSTQPEKYATLFLAHYDAASCRLTYSNAGQLPPLVLSLDGSIRRLDRGGTVVGLMDGMHYEEDSFVMKPGDILIAYSDGVTEPENDFGEFGEERMVEVVRRYRASPLHEISAEVMHALDAWIGAEEQPDDITLVLARAL